MNEEGGLGSSSDYSRSVDNPPLDTARGRPCGFRHAQAAPACLEPGRGEPVKGRASTSPRKGGTSFRASGSCAVSSAGCGGALW